LPLSRGTDDEREDDCHGHELKVFLCGAVPFTRLDFGDQKVLLQTLTGANTSEPTEQYDGDDQSNLIPANLIHRQAKPQVMISRRTAILGAVAAGVLCFSAGLLVVPALEKDTEKVVQSAKADTPPGQQVAADPDPPRSMENRFT
jgi:hypothetical protein